MGGSVQVLELLWSWPDLSLAGTALCSMVWGRWSGRLPRADRRTSRGDLERGTGISPGRRRDRGPGEVSALFS